jgi:DNA polymerase (family 10)
MDVSRTFAPSTESPVTAPSNAEVARTLERVSAFLRAQRASAHRVRAWSHAAAVVRGLDREVRDVVSAEGTTGLTQLPGIGPRIASAIDEIVRTRGLGLLARLEGDLGPDAIFATLPGVGSELAHRLRDALGVESLEELEIAAHDGRLEAVPGIGARKAQAIRDSLDVTLRASRSRRTGGRATARPPVSLLLETDARYRARAASGELPRIAPRRFNLTHEPWLPVLHEEAQGFHVHAMFSNTARAHQLGRTQDWVVIFAERDGTETQHTVVTETRGENAGRRVVRGREDEGSSPLGEHQDRPSGHSPRDPRA